MLYSFKLNEPKSKLQVVHEQKFKDLSSSKWQVRVGGACWTCNSGPVVQYSLGVRFITSLFCFHVVKPVMPIIPLLPFLCISKKPLYVTSVGWDCCCNINLIGISWDSKMWQKHAPVNQQQWTWGGRGSIVYLIDLLTVLRHYDSSSKFVT